MKKYVFLFSFLIGSAFTSPAQWQLVTSPATVIGSTVAMMNGGGVCSKGPDCISGGSRGFVWGTGTTPGVGTTVVTAPAMSGPFGAAVFAAGLSGLAENTTYNYWVFANTGAAIRYGNMVSFKTHKLTSPTTNTVTDIKALSATASGTVPTMTIFGDPQVTARGVLWNTTDSRPAMTTSNRANTVDPATLNYNTYTCGITGLTQGTKYYVWAFTTYSNGVTKYGNSVNFTTLTLPTVTTSAATATGYTTATSGGNVTSDGGNPVTARGVCYSSSSSSPTISGSKTTDGTGTGTFNSSVTGLSDNTTYHIRAYATSAAGPGYGESRSITTPKKVYPTVNAGPDVPLTLPANSVTLSGTATDADGSITGHIWSRVSGTGTIASATSFSTAVNGLAEGISTFKLTATDNTGLISTDEVKVTVVSPPKPDLTVSWGTRFTTTGQWDQTSTETNTFGLCSYATGSASKTTTIPALTITVTNSGQSATTTTCILKVTHGTNANVADQTFTIPVLAVGATKTFNVVRSENRVCATKQGNPQVECMRCAENVVPWWSDRGLSAKADNGNVIDESNESNNTSAIP